MGAGEHDGVGAPGVLIDETGRDFGGDRGIGHRVTGEFGLGKGCKPRGTDEINLAALRRIRGSAPGYIRAHTVACVPSTADAL